LSLAAARAVQYPRPAPRAGRIGTASPSPTTQESPIAKKPRRRPTAGPPPVKNPRHEAKVTGATDTDRPAKRQPGEPMRPTFLSVVVRSVLAIAVFLIVTIASGSTLNQVAPIAAVLLVAMVVFGHWFDKWFYKYRMKRWEARRGGRKA
jgi:hypothetical protein